MKEQTPTLQHALFAIPLLFALGLYNLGGDLSTGEQTYLTRSAGSLTAISNSLYSPVYLVLLKGWSHWIDSPFWLRLPNLIVAVGALLLSNRVVRSSGGTHAAPGALLLLAAAPFLIAHVQTLSPAALALLVAMASLSCFVDYVRTGNHIWLGLWVLATLLSWGVHAGLAHLLLIKWVYTIAYRDRIRSRQLYWWLAQVPVAGFFLAVFGPGVRQLVQRLMSADGAGVLVDFSTLTSGVPRPAGLFGAGLFALFLLCGIWASRDWRRDTRHGLLLLGFTAPTLLYLSPVGHPSLGLVALPFLCTLASMGIRLFPQWIRQLMWAAVTLTYLYGYWYIFA